MKQSPKRNSALRKMLLLLALPAVLLMGCAAPSTTSVQVSPTLPQPPSLREPTPQQSYSERASTNIEAWRNRLIGTLQTQ